MKERKTTDSTTLVKRDDSVTSPDVYTRERERSDKCGKYFARHIDIKRHDKQFTKLQQPADLFRNFLRYNPANETIAVSVTTCILV